MKNTFGNALGLTIFGESHGAAVGAVLDGLAAGLPVDEAYIAERMDRRRARGDGLSTARTEPDVVEFLSGVVNGHTTGTPITMMIRNTNTRSGDYAKTADLLRPGHADYTAYAKYEGWQDARGGGHFSGRITAASVAAGSICEHILAQRGIKVYTHIARCAGVEDAPLSSSAGLIMAEPQPGHFALLDPEKEAPMQAAIRAAGAESRCIENEILMYLRRNSKTKMEVSIDEPLNVDWDGNELLLSDILGTDEDVISRRLEDEVEISLLSKAIRKLSPREQTIIRLRFGLGKENAAEKTQKEVADLLGISQSYISRLEKRIMKRLKKEIVKYE